MWLTSTSKSFWECKNLINILNVLVNDHVTSHFFQQVSSFLQQAEIYVAALKVIEWKVEIIIRLIQVVNTNSYFVCLLINIIIPESPTEKNDTTRGISTTHMINNTDHKSGYFDDGKKRQWIKNR